MYGKNVETLHEYVDPLFLPDYLGGTGGDIKSASVKYGDEICEWKQGLSGPKLWIVRADHIDFDFSSYIFAYTFKNYIHINVY